MSFQNFCKMESNVIIFHVIIWNGNWYWSSAPTLWPPDAKNWLIWKDPDAGKDWRREEKGMTEDETVGWHHWFNGHEFEKAPGVGDGQGSLECYSPWGCKVLDMTEQLKTNSLKLKTQDRGTKKTGRRIKIIRQTLESKMLRTAGV